MGICLLFVSTMYDRLWSILRSILPSNNDIPFISVSILRHTTGTPPASGTAPDETGSRDAISSITEHVADSESLTTGSSVDTLSAEFDSGGEPSEICDSLLS